MKKRIAAFSSVLALCISMTSCGKTEAANDIDEPVTSATTVTTVAETTTTAAETTADAEETTTAKKKKKKKKTSTTGSEKDASSSKESNKETTKEVLKEAAKELSTLDNSVFTLSFSESNWISTNDYKEIIAQIAGAQSNLFSASDFSSMLGSMYFYKDDVKNSYPTNFIVSNPVYQQAFSSVSIYDITDLMVQTIQQQFDAEGGYMNLVSHDMVTHGGVNMLKLSAYAEKDGVSFNCDEYVFLINGNLCVVAINSAEGAKGLAEFEKILDTIKIK